MENNQIIAKPELSLGSPVEVMARLGGMNLNPETIASLMTLQERWEANQARKAYIAAMVQFKNNSPKLKKDKRVNHPGGKYSYANIGTIVEQITPELAKYGFSASWKKNESDSSVTCVLTHEAGHSETATLSGPDDLSGSKNPLQGLGSTLSYLERYSILMVTGLATSDMDDDGAASASNQLLTEEMLAQIQASLSEYSDEEKAKFLKFMKVEAVEYIQKSDFTKAINAINLKKPTKK